MGQTLNGMLLPTTWKGQVTQRPLNNAVNGGLTSWMHQIDPELNRTGWSREENVKLFALQKSLKSHWKKIAENFHGRTDNSIKNQFFSVVRKALRKICKALGKVANTLVVNRIKPKVLSEFLALDLEFQIEGKEENMKVDVSSLVQKFAFTKYQELASSLGEHDILVIQHCMDHLNELNDSYMKKKKIKKKKRGRDQILNKDDEDEDNNKGANLFAREARMTRVRPEGNMSNESIVEIKKKFEDLFKSNMNVSTVSPEKEKSRKKLISFFDSLGNLSQKVKGVLQNTHSTELDGLKISNIFSITDTTKKFFNAEEEPTNNKSNFDMNSFFNNCLEPNKKAVSPQIPSLNNFSLFMGAPGGLTHQIAKPEKKKPTEKKFEETLNRMFSKNDYLQVGMNNSLNNSNGMFHSKLLNESGRSGVNLMNRNNMLSILNESGRSNVRYNNLSHFFKSKTYNNSDDEIQGNQ